MLRSAISAFTRVFDALCLGRLGALQSGVHRTPWALLWVPALRSSAKGAAPRPGHERNLLSAPCGDLPVGLFVDRRVESFISDFPKNICCHLTQIKSRTLASHPTRGAYHDRHGRGEGCGGRSSVGRAMRAQGGLLSVSG